VPELVLILLAALGQAEPQSPEPPEDILAIGSFERTEGRLPSGWALEKGPAEAVSVSSDRPHGGRRCLRLAIANGQQVRLEAVDPVDVEPGRTYRVRYYYRIEKTSVPRGKTVNFRGFYADAEGKRLAWRQFPGPSAAAQYREPLRHDWTLVERDFTVPVGPAKLLPVLESWRDWEGTVSVDDLKLLELPRPEFDPPDGCRAFQFLPIDAASAPGFTPVRFNRSFEQHKDFGFAIPPGEALRRGQFMTQDDYPTRLQAHAVRAAFSCALPDGTYVASAYMGSLWRTGGQQMGDVLEVDRRRLVDRSRSRNRFMDEEYFRYVHATLVTPDDLKRRGLAVHQRYIRPRFRRHDFKVTVAGGRLDVRPRSGYLSAIVLTPEAQAAEHREAVEALHRRLAHEFAGRWCQLLPTEGWRGAHRGNYRPNPAERKRGYVLFRRPWMQAVQHDCRPSAAEVEVDLSTFATPGEYEPLSFSVWPLRDLLRVAVTVSDLKGEADAVIPAGAVRVWYLQHRPVRRARPCTAYWIRGTFLPDWKTRTLYKDIAQRCWLSVRVPDDAKPGLYKGRVRITSADAPAAELALAMRVLPFKLVRPKRIHVLRRGGNQVLVPYEASYPVKPGDARNKQFYRQAALGDLAAHGFMPEFSVWWRSFFSPEEGRILWDKPDALSGPPGQFLQMIEDSPFGKQEVLWVDAASATGDLLAAFGEKPGRWTRDDVKAWLKDLSAATAAKGFTKAYLHASAEESHYAKDNGRERWVRFLRFVRENRADWPNLLTAHTCNTEWGQPIALAEADLTGLGMFHGVTFSAAAQVKQARAAGRPFLLYGVRGRMVIGFYLWKAGAAGTFHEFYAPYWGQPNNDWDNPLGMDTHSRQVMSEAPGWCNVTYSPTGRMIGSWFWEQLREGVDDDAYMHTLQHWMARAAGHDSPRVKAALRAAEQAVTEIADRIDLDLDPKATQGPPGLSLYQPLEPLDFDQLRWTAALATKRLKAAMERGAR